MIVLATRPTPSAWAKILHCGQILVARAGAAYVSYCRAVRTRRAVRLFRAMDEALEAGNRRDAERLFRVASVAAVDNLKIPRECF